MAHSEPAPQGGVRPSTCGGDGALMALLSSLEISFQLRSTPSLRTMEACRELRRCGGEGGDGDGDADSDGNGGAPPGVFCKNLFVRDKKKQFFLVTALEDTPVDLKSLRKELGAFRCLTFATEEELASKLGVAPGGVTPLAAAVRCQGSPDVRVVLDAGLLHAGLANFHPFDPLATVTMAPGDLLRLLSHCRVPHQTHTFSEPSPSEVQEQ